jgi:surface protein
MLISHDSPGEWLHFIERKDNKGLPLLELKEKYRDEQILFENYITNVDQHKFMIAQQAAGGSAKGKAYAAGGGAIDKFGVRISIPTDNFEFKLGITKNGALSTFSVDWADGSAIENGSGIPTHTFATAGNYDVEIWGDWDRLEQGTNGVTALQTQAITFVLDWGGIQWSSMENAFSGCSNLVGFAAANAPDLSLVTSMARMLNGAPLFYSPLNSWDVSNVTNMDGLFLSTVDTRYNQPLNSWDTSKVTNMGQMFYGNTEFNQDLSGWDTSKVTAMDSMFNGASKFNQNIGGWDVSKVENMGGMLRLALVFNNGGSDTIKDWVTSSLTSVTNLFRDCSSFNQPLSGWDVSNVVNMNNMFMGTTIFNQDLSTWVVSSVTSMQDMFNASSRFNGNITTWNTSLVRTMKNMFKNALDFNQDIGSWNVSSVNTMDSMFHGAWDFNGNVNIWTTTSLVDIDFMFFDALVFSQPIGSWDTTSVTTCKAVFFGASVFNQPLNTWEMNGVVRTNDMFKNATLFNQDLSGWNTSTIFNMNSMFNGATSFSQDIGAWDVGALTTATLMFVSSGMTTTNYNSLLQGWVNSSRLVNTTFSNDLTYTIASDTARTSIVNTPWTVNDGGQV